MASIYVSRDGQVNLLQPFHPARLEPPDRAKMRTKIPVLFTTVAFIFIITGSLVTWRGEVTGPLLIALAVPLFLLAIGQVVITKKRQNSTRNGLKVGQPRHVHRWTEIAQVNDDGAVPVLDSNSIDQETQDRNSDTFNKEKNEATMHSEVTTCLPGSVLVCNTPEESQDQPPSQPPPPPPPSYEEAIMGDNSRPSLQPHSEESAPAYSPQGQSETQNQTTNLPRTVK